MKIVGKWWIFLALVCVFPLGSHGQKGRGRGVPILARLADPSVLKDGNKNQNEILYPPPIRFIPSLQEAFLVYAKRHPFRRQLLSELNADKEGGKNRFTLEDLAALRYFNNFLKAEFTRKNGESLELDVTPPSKEPSTISTSKNEGIHEISSSKENNEKRQNPTMEKEGHHEEKNIASTTYYKTTIKQPPENFDEKEQSEEGLNSNLEEHIKPKDKEIIISVEPADDNTNKQKGIYKERNINEEVGLVRNIDDSVTEIIQTVDSPDKIDENKTAILISTESSNSASVGENKFTEIPFINSRGRGRKRLGTKQTSPEIENQPTEAIKAEISSETSTKLSKEGFQENISFHDELQIDIPHVQEREKSSQPKVQGELLIINVPDEIPAPIDEKPRKGHFDDNNNGENYASEKNMYIRPRPTENNIQFRPTEGNIKFRPTEKVIQSIGHNKETENNKQEEMNKTIRLNHFNVETNNNSEEKSIKPPSGRRRKINRNNAPTTQQTISTEIKENVDVDIQTTNTQYNVRRREKVTTVNPVINTPRVNLVAARRRNSEHQRNTDTNQETTTPTTPRRSSRRRTAKPTTSASEITIQPATKNDNVTNTRRRNRNKRRRTDQAESNTESIFLIREESKNLALAIKESVDTFRILGISTNISENVDEVLDKELNSKELNNKSNVDVIEKHTLPINKETLEIKMSNEQIKENNNLNNYEKEFNNKTNYDITEEKILPTHEKIMENKTPSEYIQENINLNRKENISSMPDHLIITNSAEREIISRLMYDDKKTLQNKSSDDKFNKDIRNDHANEKNDGDKNKDNISNKEVIKDLNIVSAQGVETKLQKNSDEGKLVIEQINVEEKETNKNKSTKRIDTYSENNKSTSSDSKTNTNLNNSEESVHYKDETNSKSNTKEEIKTNEDIKLRNDETLPTPLPFINRNTQNNLDNTKQIQSEEKEINFKNDEHKNIYNPEPVTQQRITTLNKKETQNVNNFEEVHYPVIHNITPIPLPYKEGIVATESLPQKALNSFEQFKNDDIKLIEETRFNDTIINEDEKKEIDIAKIEVATFSSIQEFRSSERQTENIELLENQERINKNQQHQRRSKIRRRGEGRRKPTTQKYSDNTQISSTEVHNWNFHDENVNKENVELIVSNNKPNDLNNVNKEYSQQSKLKTEDTTLTTPTNIKELNMSSAEDIPRITTTEYTIETMPKSNVLIVSVEKNETIVDKSVNTEYNKSIKQLPKLLPMHNISQESTTTTFSPEKSMNTVFSTSEDSVDHNDRNIPKEIPKRKDITALRIQRRRDKEKIRNTSTKKTNKIESSIKFVEVSNIQSVEDLPIIHKDINGKDKDFIFTELNANKADSSFNSQDTKTEAILEKPVINEEKNNVTDTIWKSKTTETYSPNIDSVKFVINKDKQEKDTTLLLDNYKIKDNDKILSEETTKTGYNMNEDKNLTDKTKSLMVYNNKQTTKEIDDILLNENNTVSINNNTDARESKENEDIVVKPLKEADKRGKHTSNREQSKIIKSEEKPVEEHGKHDTSSSGDGTIIKNQENVTKDTTNESLIKEKEINENSSETILENSNLERKINFKQIPQLELKEDMKYKKTLQNINDEQIISFQQSAKISKISRINEHSESSSENANVSAATIDITEPSIFNVENDSKSKIIEELLDHQESKHGVLSGEILENKQTEFRKHSRRNDTFKYSEEIIVPTENHSSLEKKFVSENTDKELVQSLKTEVKAETEVKLTIDDKENKNISNEDTIHTNTEYTTNIKEENNLNVANDSTFIQRGQKKYSVISHENTGLNNKNGANDRNINNEQPSNRRNGGRTGNFIRSQSTSEALINEKEGQVTIGGRSRINSSTANIDDMTATTGNVKDATIKNEYAAISLDETSNNEPFLEKSSDKNEVKIKENTAVPDPDKNSSSKNKFVNTENEEIEQTHSSDKHTKPIQGENVIIEEDTPKENETSPHNKRNEELPNKSAAANKTNNENIIQDKLSYSKNTEEQKDSITNTDTEENTRREKTAVSRRRNLRKNTVETTLIESHNQNKENQSNARRNNRRRQNKNNTTNNDKGFENIKRARNSEVRRASTTPKFNENETTNKPPRQRSRNNNRKIIAEEKPVARSRGIIQETKGTLSSKSRSRQRPRTQITREIDEVSSSKKQEETDMSDTVSTTRKPRVNPNRTRRLKSRVALLVGKPTQPPDSFRVVPKRWKIPPAGVRLPRLKTDSNASKRGKREIGTINDFVRVNSTRRIESRRNKNDNVEKSSPIELVQEREKNSRIYNQPLRNKNDKFKIELQTQNENKQEHRINPRTRNNNRRNGQAITIIDSFQTYKEQINKQMQIEKFDTQKKVDSESIDFINHEEEFARNQRIKQNKLFTDRNTNLQTFGHDVGILNNQFHKNIQSGTTRDELNVLRRNINQRIKPVQLFDDRMTIESVESNDQQIERSASKDQNPPRQIENVNAKEPIKQAQNILNNQRRNRNNYTFTRMHGITEKNPTEVKSEKKIGIAQNQMGNRVHDSNFEVNNKNTIERHLTITEKNTLYSQTDKFKLEDTQNYSMAKNVRNGRNKSRKTHSRNLKLNNEESNEKDLIKLNKGGPEDIKNSNIEDENSNISINHVRSNYNTEEKVARSSAYLSNVFEQNEHTILTFEQNPSFNYQPIGYQPIFYQNTYFVPAYPIRQKQPQNMYPTTATGTLLVTGSTASKLNIKSTTTQNTVANKHEQMMHSNQKHNIDEIIRDHSNTHKFEVSSTLYNSSTQPYLEDITTNMPAISPIGSTTQRQRRRTTSKLYETITTHKPDSTDQEIFISDPNLQLNQISSITENPKRRSTVTFTPSIFSNERTTTKPIIETTKRPIINIQNQETTSYTAKVLDYLQVLDNRRRPIQIQRTTKLPQTLTTLDENIRQTTQAMESNEYKVAHGVTASMRRPYINRRITKHPEINTSEINLANSQLEFTRPLINRRPTKYPEINNSKINSKESPNEKILRTQAESIAPTRKPPINRRTTKDSEINQSTTQSEYDFSTADALSTRTNGIALATGRPLINRRTTTTIPDSSDIPGFITTTTNRRRRPRILSTPSTEQNRTRIITSKTIIQRNAKSATPVNNLKDTAQTMNQEENKQLITTEIEDINTNFVNEKPTNLLRIQTSGAKNYQKREKIRKPTIENKEVTTEATINRHRFTQRQVLTTTITSDKSITENSKSGTDQTTSPPTRRSRGTRATTVAPRSTEEQTKLDFKFNDNMNVRNKPDHLKNKIRGLSRVTTAPPIISNNEIKKSSIYTIAPIITESTTLNNDNLITTKHRTTTDINMNAATDQINQNVQKQTTAKRRFKTTSKPTTKIIDGRRRGKTTVINPISGNAEKNKSTHGIMNLNQITSMVNLSESDNVNKLDDIKVTSNSFNNDEDTFALKNINDIINIVRNKENKNIRTGSRYLKFKKEKSLNQNEYQKEELQNDKSDAVQLEELNIGNNKNIEKDKQNKLRKGIKSSTYNYNRHSPESENTRESIILETLKGTLRTKSHQTQRDLYESKENTLRENIDNTMIYRKRGRGKWKPEDGSPGKSISD